MYGPLVIAYLFLGGTAAGGLFSICAWSLAFNALNQRLSPCATLRKSTRDPEARPSAPATSIALRRTQAFVALQERVLPLCTLLLGFAVVMLFWDLGSPDKVLYLLLRPRFTVLTFGALCLSFEIAVGALLTWSALFHTQRLQGIAKRALEILCCLLSVATMAYTGVFLVTSVGVPFWSSWWLVPLFVCSSLSGGLSLMLLVDYFVSDQTLLLCAARPLQIWHLGCLAVEAICLAAFALATLANPEARHGIDVLLSRDVLSTAIVGVVGFGIAFPAILESYALAQQPCRTIPVADALCLCGGLCLRFCVIVCGVHMA